MASNYRVNEKGQVITVLPASGTQVRLRTPKGKDLKAIELASSAVGATSSGTMMLLASLLCVEPELTLEEVEDMEVDDILRLGECLNAFPSLSRLGSQ